VHCIDPKVPEGFHRNGDKGLNQVKDGIGVVPNLLLGVFIHTKVEVMHEIVEIDLPIEFGISTLWKITPSLFTADPLFEKVLIDLKRMF